MRGRASQIRRISQRTHDVRGRLHQTDDVREPTEATSCQNYGECRGEPTATTPASPTTARATNVDSVNPQTQHYVDPQRLLGRRQYLVVGNAEGTGRGQRLDVRVDRRNRTREPV